MVYQTFNNKRLVEEGDLFIWNNGMRYMSQEFFNSLVGRFVPMENLEMINTYIKNIVRIKEDIEVLELSRKDNIQKEFESIARDVLNFKAELKNETNRAKEDIKKFKEDCKKDLSKKFLLELGSPIPEKNKATRNALEELRIASIEGIEEIAVRNKFIKYAREVLPRLELTKDTKNILLTLATSEEKYWERSPENEYLWKNLKFSFSLKKIINLVDSGEEPSNIQLDTTKDGRIICKEGKGDMVDVLEKEPITKKISDKKEDEDLII